MKQISIIATTALLMLLASSASANTECTSCHGDEKRGITMNQHASKAIACTSCHGEAKQHQEDPSVRDFVDFKKKIQTEDVNKSCLNCHRQSRKMMNWDGSAHQSGEVPCSSCHTIHSEARQKVGSERCFSCHRQVRNDVNKLSRHPVREGRLECSSCHDAHGSQYPKLMNKSSVNDLCVSCHVEKRGPFRFAHAPVQDNCLTCHSAHGSSKPRLLSQNIRNTCTNCHVFGRKRDLHQENIGSTSSAMTVRGSCINCHGNIHGSNTDYLFR